MPEKKTVFISFGCDASKEIANILKDKIPLFIPVVDVFCSQYIKKGQGWLQEILTNLTHSFFGIICLTPESKEKPWLLFEAGVLYNALTDYTVATLLFNLEKANEPLSHFQHTIFRRDDFEKLVLSINKNLKDNAIEERVIKGNFNHNWEILKENIDSVLHKFDTSKPPVDKAIELQDVFNKIEGVHSLVKNLERAFSTSLMSDNPELDRMPSIRLTAFTLIKLLSGFPQDQIESLCIRAQQRRSRYKWSTSSKYPLRINRYPLDEELTDEEHSSFKESEDEESKQTQETWTSDYD